MTDEEIENKKLLERASMFYDAVFAIVLTLLVLELRLPEEGIGDKPAAMWHGVQEMSPRLLAFFLSVTLIGGSWISSINIQRMMKSANFGVVVLFVTYLCLISLTPFVCSVIGSYPGNPLSYIIFGAVALMVQINTIFFLRHCRKTKVYHQNVDMNAILKLEKYLLVFMLYTAIIASLAFYSTKLSFILFLIYNLVPFFFTNRLKKIGPPKGT